MKRTNRRTFLRQSTTMLGTAGFLTTFPQILNNRHNGIAPSDQLNVGLIGARGRGFRVLQQHLDVGGVNCVALCDIDENVLSEKAKTLEEKYQQKVKLFKDFRELIAMKDIDAVIIGTPDHWHCLPMVYACQEGKDVYVEKPMANTIAECDVMQAAARRYNRIVQVGQQQRSGKVWLEVMDYLKSGKLGYLRKTNIWANFHYGMGPQKQPNGTPPAGVDYDRYLGPAPGRPFNPARFHGGWRFFWDYGGGLMTDFGAHLIDMALWAKDITTPPKEVLAYGSKLKDPGRAAETFDTQTAIFPYDDYLIQWEHSAGKQTGPYGRNYGLAFLGDNGTLVVDRSGWQVIPEWDNSAKANKTEEYQSPKFNSGHDSHIRNFIDGVKNRKEPAATVEIGRTVAVCAHMANIAVRTGAHQLFWDDAKSRFTNSKAANQLVQPEYRKPWKFPNL